MAVRAGVPAASRWTVDDGGTELGRPRGVAAGLCLASGAAVLCAADCSVHAGNKGAVGRAGAHAYWSRAVAREFAIGFAGAYCHGGSGGEAFTNSAERRPVCGAGFEAILGDSASGCEQRRVPDCRRGQFDRANTSDPASETTVFLRRAGQGARSGAEFFGDAVAGCEQGGSSHEQFPSAAASQPAGDAAAILLRGA